MLIVTLFIRQKHVVDVIFIGRSDKFPHQQSKNRTRRCVLKADWKLKSPIFGVPELSSMPQEEQLSTN
jgi:hypothetical protein